MSNIMRKKAVYVDRNIFNVIEGVMDAYENMDGRYICRGDIVNMAMDKLMKELDIRPISTKEEIDRAVIITTNLAKKEGIKVE